MALKVVQTKRIVCLCQKSAVAKRGRLDGWVEEAIALTGGARIGGREK